MNASERNALASNRPDRSRILTINGGSSSLKFALFERAEPPVRIVWGRVERIGLPDARLIVERAEGEREEQAIAAPDPGAAVRAVIERIESAEGLGTIGVVGHRIVHGGTRYSAPERVTSEMIDELHRVSPYDPKHLPGEIVLIEAFRDLDPELPQVACFDTAFHHDLPRVARIVPIPRRFEQAGVRRYGFHGLSYSYLMDELTRIGGASEARGRVVLAHLGSGASMAAVRDGHCLDTTMCFTPAAGLVMGTRTGDLDPGLVLYLAKTQGFSAEQFDHLVNQESGLLGISETSPDTRDLFTREHEDVRAAEALAVFCYQARKWIGAFSAALGGLDTLVFAAGIGENSPEIRARICEGLEFLGIALDAERNAASAPLISTDSARVRVRVIRTDEELTIARACVRMLNAN